MYNFFTPMHAGALAERHYDAAAIDVASRINNEIESEHKPKAEELARTRDQAIADLSRVLETATESHGKVKLDHDSPYAAIFEMALKAKHLFQEWSMPLLNMLETIPETTANKLIKALMQSELKV